MPRLIKLLQNTISFILNLTPFFFPLVVNIESYKLIFGLIFGTVNVKYEKESKFKH